MRRILASLLVAGVATVAAAADKRMTLAGGDTLTMKWGADWVVGEGLPDAPFGTFTIHGTDPAIWRVTLAPLPPHPTLTGDTGNLRIYVRNMARGLEDAGAEVDMEQKTLDGANARGFYVKVRDLRPAPKSKIKAKSGDYSYGYIGALSINSRPYLFEVAWNNGGEPAAGAALAALKTIRIQ